MTARKLPEQLEHFFAANEVHDILWNDPARGASGTTYNCKLHGRRYHAWTEEVAWYAFLALNAAIGGGFVASGLVASHQNQGLASGLGIACYVAIALAIVALVSIAVYRSKTTRHLWVEVLESGTDADLALARLCDTIADVRAWQLPMWPVHEGWLVTHSRPSSARIEAANRAHVRCFLIEASSVTELMGAEVANATTPASVGMAVMVPTGG